MEASVGKASLRTSSQDPDLGGIVWNHTLGFEVDDADSELRLAVGTRTHIFRQHLNVRELGEITISVASLEPHEEVCLYLCTSRVVTLSHPVVFRCRRLSGTG